MASSECESTTVLYRFSNCSFVSFDSSTKCELSMRRQHCKSSSAITTQAVILTADKVLNSSHQLSLGPVVRVSWNALEHHSGAPSKPKKAFWTLKCQYWGSNNAISKCVQLLYLELAALPRSPSWWGEGLLCLPQEFQPAFNLWCQFLALRSSSAD